MIVMHPEQKAEAERWFSTPLIFSIQEAKGLEYDNVILYNFIAGEAKAFREIAVGVDPVDLEREELSYARARDKHDKSLEVYKFFINALYVAATRAVRNLYVIEDDRRHPALRLLELDRFAGALDAEKEASSREDWQREARKLELQGKAEQAEAIRKRVLEQKAVPWTVLDRAAFQELRDQALGEGGGKKVRLEAFEWAVIHHHRSTLNALERIGFKPATRSEEIAVRHLNSNHFMAYDLSNPRAVLGDVDRYGVDHRTRFNLTPLMIAARLGNEALVRILRERGADPGLRASNGFTALHFALEQALTDSSYARRRLPQVYQLLEPDSVSVQVEDRLVKLDKRLMETFMLYFLTASFYRVLGPAIASRGHAFSARELVTTLERLPDSVLPPRRKQRTYVSSILSKNEINRDDRYNRRLFLRMQRGEYILNPRLKLRSGDRWLPIHDVFPLQDLGIVKPDPSPMGIQGGAGYVEWQWEQREQRLEQFRTRVRELADNEELS